jgi:Ca2+-binding RTX toxin-like protein
LAFSNLVITQGNGTDTAVSNVVIKTSSGEILAVITGVQQQNVNQFDFSGLSTEPQSLTGSAGSDALIGGAGNDTLTGGGGSDTILGAGGDDTISVGGNGGQPFQTTVDGGSGSNSLSISYTAITKLSDFPVRTMDSAGALTLGDASGGVFVIKNIDLRAGKLSVAGRSYDFVDPLPSCNCRGRSNMHDGSLGSTQGVAIHPASGEVVLYLEGSYATFHASRVSNVSYNLQSVPLSIFGTSQKDIVSGGGQGDVILTYGGNDHIYPKGGADSVSSGLGDDVIFVNQASLNEDSLLDGGDGFDILNFGFVYNLDGAGPSISAVTLDMGALGSAINFEGIVGSYFADRITGDSRGNLIIGGGEADLLIGGAGDDIIFGDFDPADGGGDKYGLRQYDVNSSQGNDILRGGEGQDRLDGNDGNDELDGGLGADVLRGGGGVDTFVLRAGDGGSTVAQADTITDFQDGTDVLGLAGGLAFSNLVITQGNGTDTAASNVVIKTSSGEILAVVVGVEVSRISILDFSQISASNPASGIASIPMSPSIGGASSRIGSTIIRAVEQGALQLASATEDTTTGSQYQLRSGIDAVEGQIWQLDYLNSGGSVLSSARLPSTSVVAWRREDRRGVDLPTTAWVRLCGTQLYTLQDGYQLLAGGRSRTLQNGWQSEIVVKGGAEAVLVTGASCSGESLVVSGYAFGVSADEPPLRDEAVPATSFKLKLDPMGRESARKSEARPISVGEICALPRAPELEGFCRAAEAALQ